MENLVTAQHKTRLKRKVNISDGLSMKEIYRLGQEWASIEGGAAGVPGGSYSGQAKYSAKEFMNLYKSKGGQPQKKQGGGPVKPVSKGIDKLQDMIKEEVATFFEQSDLQNQYVAMNGEPHVIFAGGESSGGEEQLGSISMMNSVNNLPNYNIPARDNCPLSMFYTYNPSFNPMGIGVQ